LRKVRRETEERVPSSLVLVWTTEDAIFCAESICVRKCSFCGVGLTNPPRLYWTCASSGFPSVRFGLLHRWIRVSFHKVQRPSRDVRLVETSDRLGAEPATNAVRRYDGLFAPCGTSAWNVPRCEPAFLLCNRALAANHSCRRCPGKLQSCSAWNLLDAGFVAFWKLQYRCDTVAERNVDTALLMMSCKHDDRYHHRHRPYARLPSNRYSLVRLAMEKHKAHLHKEFDAMFIERKTHLPAKRFTTGLWRQGLRVSHEKVP